MKESLVSIARKSLDLDEKEFAAWLSERVVEPDVSYSGQVVKAWESGQTEPDKCAKELCSALASNEIASDAILLVCSVFRKAGVHVLDISMSPSMREAKQHIADKIKALA